MLTAFFVTAALGRIGLAMTSLALLWLVHDRTGSWTTAGLASAGLAVAEGVAGPQTARLVDRFGQTRVLPGLALGQGLALVAVLGWTSPTTPAAVVVALGSAVGATVPQLGAFTAARWSHRVHDPTLLGRAFGWEAVANSTAFLLGPVLVAVVAGSGRPGVAVALSGVLVCGATVGLAGLRGSAPPVVAGRRGGAGVPRGVRVPLAVNALLGVHFGAVPLAVTATVVAAGRPTAAAWVFAASSAGGLLAGVVLARRTRAPSLARSAWALGAAGALLLVPVPLGVLAALLFVVGAAVPPVVVAAAVLTRARAAPHRLTSTFAWMASVSAAGSAASAALAGTLVEGVGPWAAFAVAGLAAAAVGVTEKILR